MRVAAAVEVHIGGAEGERADGRVQGLVQALEERELQPMVHRPERLAGLAAGPGPRAAAGAVVEFRARAAAEVRAPRPADLALRPRGGRLSGSGLLHRLGPRPLAHRDRERRLAVPGAVAGVPRGLCRKCRGCCGGLQCGGLRGLRPLVGRGGSGMLGGGVSGLQESAHGGLAGLLAGNADNLLQVLEGLGAPWCGGLHSPLGADVRRHVSRRLAGDLGTVLHGLSRCTRLHDQAAA
mmetsp:Transcript_149355/g.479637  ORF Transcript_149355/g.479637 Transcript_149355/m.479637 type:complete len:237 (-) Transcript_149355:689-1399(-)